MTATPRSRRRWGTTSVDISPNSMVSWAICGSVTGRRWRPSNGTTKKYRLRVRRQIATRLLTPVVMGFVLLAVLAAGGWGLAQWSGYRLRTSVAALAEVEDRITAAELEWTELRDGSWGVGLIEIDGQCYVLVPEDADAETFVRIDGRRAVGLPCRGSGE